MRRCAVEETIVLQAFEERIAARSDLGFVVATTELHRDASVTVSLSDVGCTPLCLISLAAELLAAGQEMLEAQPDVREMASDLLACVIAARASLAAEASCERVS